MKIVMLYLAMLCFNIGAQFVLHSGIFAVTPSYADSSFMYNVNNTMQANYTGNLDYTQQYALAADVIGSITAGITFDWVFWYMPAELQATDNIVALRAGLLAIAIIINAAAILELWLRRGDIFK